MITNILRIRPGGKGTVDLEDVVIVMDGSGSIGKCEFDNGKKAMQTLMEFEQPEIDAKYGMVTFGYIARIDFDFSPQLKAAKKVGVVTFPRAGSTNTQAGLAQALNLFVSGENDCASVIIINFSFEQIKEALKHERRSNPNPLCQHYFRKNLQESKDLQKNNRFDRIIIKHCSCVFGVMLFLYGCDQL